MKNKLSFLFILCLGLTLAFSPACNTSKTAKGAVIGGAAGGVIGGVIGKSTGNTAAGIIVGSAVGGTAGAVIGKYMDKQAKELEQEMDNATVERVGEGILVTFDGGLLFDFGKSTLTPKTKENLNEMAKIMNDYPETDITVDGHTDSVGSDSFNQKLSEERAASVANYLAAQGISRSRITQHGYGEEKPVASNDTDAGRAQNRRVEVAITANEKLQEDAEDGTIDGQ